MGDRLKYSERQQDWVNEYLSSNNVCELELYETLEDLQDTVRLMFDVETEKQVREIEYRNSAFGREAVHTPSIRGARSQIRRSVTDDSESGDSHHEAEQAELRPQPLFSERRVFTHPGAHPAHRDTHTSSSEASMDSMSSYEMGSTTTATTMSPISPTTIELPDVEERYNFMRGDGVPLMPPSRNPARMANAEREMFPPRRSSLHARSMMVTPTPANPPTSATFPCRTSSLMHANDPFRTQSSNKRASLLPEEMVQQSKLQRAKSMATFGRPTPLQLRERPSTGPMSTPTPAAPFTKPWNPPPYRQTKPERLAKAPKFKSNDHRKRMSFQQTLAALQKSATTSTLSIASSSQSFKISSPTGNEEYGFSFNTSPCLSPPRHDSLAPLAAPSIHGDMHIPRNHPRHRLGLAIPRYGSTMVAEHHPVLPPVPSPAKSDQLMMEIEDGFRTMNCTSMYEAHHPVPQSSSPTKATSVKGHGSMRRIASVAGGQFQKRFSVTFSGAEDDTSINPRNSVHSQVSSSPSWVTVPADQPYQLSAFTFAHIFPTKPKMERIVDLNGLLSHPRLNTLQRSQSMWSTTTDNTSISSHPNSSSLSLSLFNPIRPLRMKRSRTNIMDDDFQSFPYDDMHTPSIRDSRSGMEVPRHLQKPHRVLGLFEEVVGGLQRQTSKELDEKLEGAEVVKTAEKKRKRKLRKEKDERGGKEGKKRKRDEFFEAMSKALELG